MKLNADLFPYPVLYNGTDDFSSGIFTVDFSEKNHDEDKVVLTFEIHLDNPEIEELLKVGKVKVAIHIEGSLTSFRKLVCLENGERQGEIELDSTDILGPVEINSMIISTERIIDYHNSGFNVDYYGDDLIIPVIEKGSILAYDNGVEVAFDFSNRERLNLQSMIRVSSKKQEYMSVDLDGDKIRINLPEKAYDTYIHLSNASLQLQNLMLITVVFPALTYTITQVIADKVEDNLDWYLSLRGLLEKRGIDIDVMVDSDIDPMEIAQKLLPISVEHAMLDFYKMEDGDSK